MWPTCRFLWHESPAPCCLALVRGMSGRMGRGFLCLILLSSQIGLPNFSLWVAATTACQTGTNGNDTGCRCAPRLRSLGRCCCAAGRLASARRCCAKPETAPQPKSCCSRSVKTETAFRDACHCGARADVLAYRCADPRVLPPRLNISADDVPAQIDAIGNDSLCGELLPPPLPPPKSASC